jgi:transcriptional regulator with XRE-family HTH domain
MIGRERRCPVKTIRQLREERGWTQLELAIKLNVTPATVYNWERGKYEPAASKLRQIAQAFSVSMDDITLEEPAEAKRVA